MQVAVPGFISFLRLQLKFAFDNLLTFPISFTMFRQRMHRFFILGLGREGLVASFGRPLPYSAEAYICFYVTRIDACRVAATLSDKALAMRVDYWKRDTTSDGCLKWWKHWDRRADSSTKTLGSFLDKHFVRSCEEVEYEGRFDLSDDGITSCWGCSGRCHYRSVV